MHIILCMMTKPTGLVSSTRRVFNDASKNLYIIKSVWVQPYGPFHASFYANLYAIIWQWPMQAPSGQYHNIILFIVSCWKASREWTYYGDDLLIGMGIAIASLPCLHCSSCIFHSCIIQYYACWNAAWERAWGRGLVNRPIKHAVMNTWHKYATHACLQC